MSDYRRAFQPGGTFFLTLVTENRTPIFADDGARAMLRNAIERCREFHPFELVAIVLLHDHLHLLMTLPDGDSDFSRRIAHIKSAFTRSFLASEGDEQTRSTSRLRHRTRAVWLRRFWEHTIRDEADRTGHLDYIHYNPVKHGYVDCPHAWPHSSFHRFALQRNYQRDWCCRCGGRSVAQISFDEIAKFVGE
jgi:putative transposase